MIPEFTTHVYPTERKQTWSSADLRALHGPDLNIAPNTSPHMLLAESRGHSYCTEGKKCQLCVQEGTGAGLGEQLEIS